MEISGTLAERILSFLCLGALLLWPVPAARAEHEPPTQVFDKRKAVFEEVKDSLPYIFWLQLFT